MVQAVVLAIGVCQAVIGLCYLLTRLRYGRLRARGPLRPPAGPDDLTPYELAMLAGGNRRVGEAALAELYLSGRAVAWGRGTMARPNVVPLPGETDGAETAVGLRPLSGAPFARMIDVRLRSGAAVPADMLIRIATRGDAATALLWRLRRLGLFFPPSALTGIRSCRHTAWRAQAVLGAFGVLFSGYAMVVAIAVAARTSNIVPLLIGGGLLCFPFLLHLADRLIGGILGSVSVAFAMMAGAAAGGAPFRLSAGALALFAGWFALYGCYRLTGGRLGPRTRAGDAVLREAHTRLSGEGPADSDGPLRVTAVVGLYGLRRSPARGTAPDPTVALLRSFARACGPKAGTVERGLGGDFSGDGGTGEWRDGDTLMAPPRPSQRRGSGNGRVG